MATPKGQRIGIWIIAIVMLVGTIGSFAAMILAGSNTKIDQEQQNNAYKQYQKQLEQQQKQAGALSDTYYPQFQPYKSAPVAFDANAVSDKVTTTDLKVGDGTLLTNETKYQAYYIGWNPKGTTFDSSFDGEKLKAPLDTSLMNTIPGWQQGVVGMKVGGVREITVPSDLAYGEKGRGDEIPPNTPIRFIVMVIASK